jgi:hypothetical protein
MGRPWRRIRRLLRGRNRTAFPDTSPSYLASQYNSPAFFSLPPLKQVPDRKTKAGQDIYPELSGRFPNKDEYREHFIYPDRKVRGVKQ